MLPLLRYTLDLFDLSAHPAPPGNASPNAQGNASGRAPVTPSNPADATLPPAANSYRHPNANQETRIGTTLVGYCFTRAKRRTIGFVVEPRGLVVRAPRWTPLYEVEAALQEKGRWILRKLDETRERLAKGEHTPLVWANGVVIPWLGTGLRIVLDPTQGLNGKNARLPEPPAPEPANNAGHTLLLGLPLTATAAQIGTAVQTWLMRQAHAHFLARMEHFAPLLGVRWRSMRLSNAATRWGSASADGSIRLNWRLIHFAPPVIDYVVAHELSHLREMNHSPRFWQTVATVVPNYAELRRQLKASAPPRW